MALKEAVAYARYSTDKQNARSIDDQNLVCDKIARQHGYKIVKYYNDAAISGAGTLGRAGWLEMMRAVSDKNRTFGAVIIESCSRMSRDLADSSRDFKRIDRRQIALIDIEGKLNTMRIGMSGIMNEEFRKHLGNMMRRAWDGRINDGQIPGKPPYGHRLVPGKRFCHEIDPETSRIVLRWFLEYVNRVPEREIAARLNREGVPSPSGGKWNHQVFTAGFGGGKGMLGNRRYIGKLVWNEQRNIIHPESDTKVKRKGNPEDLIVKEFPHLRIIDQDLWDRAQALRAERSRKSTKPRVYGKTITHHLIADKIVCGECGGPMRIVGSKAGEAKRVGCSNARHKGICPNSKSYNLEEIEATFLEGSKEIDAEAVAALTKGAHKEWAARQKAASVEHDAIERAINRATERIDRIGNIIIDIDPSEVPPLMEKLKSLTLERAGLRTKRDLLGAHSNVVTLLPESVRLACTEIRKLADLLSQKLSEEEATLRRMALGNYFEAVEVHQTGKRKCVEITPHLRITALMGISTMPRMQSSKEVLNEQGVTSVHSATQATLSSQKHNIINLGRWRPAA